MNRIGFLKAFLVALCAPLAALGLRKRPEPTLADMESLARQLYGPDVVPWLFNVPDADVTAYLDNPEERRLTSRLFTKENTPHVVSGLFDPWETFLRQLRRHAKDEPIHVRMTDRDTGQTVTMVFESGRAWMETSGGVRDLCG